MKLRLRGMTREDAPACAAMVVASEIGMRYGFGQEAMAMSLEGALETADELIVAESDGRVAGFAWVSPRGAFSSAPYLRLIAVDAALHSEGVGSALLADFEARTASVGRDFCLLVSDFNEGAIAFYEGHGYRRVGELPDFARSGITEIFMMKRRPTSTS